MGGTVFVRILSRFTSAISLKFQWQAKSPEQYWVNE
jgi:hypothetical protein